MKNRKMVLAGGSGFLGRTLAAYFAGDAWEVVVLSRGGGSVPSARVVRWDGRTLGPWTEELDGAEVLINLCGRSVDCRYTAQNRAAIMDSRVESTRILGEAVAKSPRPPGVWINLSTATIYTHTYGKAHDEKDGIVGASPEVLDAFSIDVAKAWEKTFDRAEVPGTRKIAMRSAMVFGGQSGGVYQVLRRLARVGLGGKMADGRQWVSWIHGKDFCRAVEWLIEKKDSRGVYNICAPNPLTNTEMMRVLREDAGMPIGLPTARWMLGIGTFLLRTEMELVVKSRKVVPGRLLDEGFAFRYPDFAAAIRDLSGRDA
jgi:uncharacterized protein